MKRNLFLLLLLALLPLPALAQTAQIAISALPAASSVSGSDLTVIVQGGVTKKASASLILNNNAATASALASTPAQCGSGLVSIGITTAGTANCVALSLASSYFANQGSTATVLHGNASGNPSWGQIVNADITTGTIATAKLASPSGDGSAVVTTTGVQTPGECVTIDANGNHVAAGAACGSGGGGGGGGDASTNTSTSVDSEVVLFSGGAGKTLKRATQTGLALLTSGVISSYGGSACTNQFVRSTNTNGTHSCQSVSLSADVTGTLGQANGGTGITALGTGVATWLGTPSSANLAAAVTGETGSGALMFGTGPTASDLVVTGSLNIPNGTAPTTDAAGEVAFDTNAWGTGRGALQIFDGTANAYAVAALASDTPTAGQVPTWQTGGTITWETPTNSGDALVANPLSQFAATTSAQLAGVISNETGSGSLVFGTSPTLVTPTLGSATASNVTISTAGALRTAQGAGNTLLVQAYDVDGGTYTTFGTLTANNTPTFDLSASTTIGGGAVLSLTAVAQGDLIYGTGANTIDVLAKSATATRYLSNTGSSNNPAWAQINLANGVTGVLPVANFTTGTPNGSKFVRDDGVLATPAGSGTVTHTGGNLTSNAVVLGAGTDDTKVVAGIITDGTSKVTLGVAGSSVGSIDFKNATSGTITLAPVTGALGTGSLLLPTATDTLVGKATTDTLTNKTYDTAGTGNSFSINGVAATANTGTGAVARAAGPTFTTPTLGVATATSVNKMAITAPATSSTLAVADGKTLTASNTLTLVGTDSTTITFQATDTYVGRATTDTFTNKTYDTGGTGNVFKAKGYIYLTHPHLCDGTNAVINTTATAITYGHATFSNSVDQATNYCEYYLQVPEDLDTGVALRGRIKVLLGNTDTGTQRYVLSSVSVADSAVPTASTLANAINLDFAGDGSGANGDVETSAWTTLTSWAGALTAGQTWRIRFARDGDTSDASTVNSTELGLVIEYGITQ